MTKFIPIRELTSTSTWKENDALVLFGELFQRGYANGLVDEAEKMGMQIIKGTVGRRDKEELRALSSEELAAIDGRIINVPLEAGFDLEKSANGVSPVDMIKDVKLSQWEDVKLDFQALEECRKNAVQRFKKQLSVYTLELEKEIKPGKNFLLAHLMAGGVPRAKIIMPLMNRVFKGVEDRHLDSAKFWNSELGKLCQLNFIEVTAETFRHLLESTASFRQKVSQMGGSVSYLAYGYHGTEILIDGQLKWQTYTPYLQGWAKMKLENISRSFFDQGIKSCVYNCPEILTNSSSIFQGVEVSLYPLLRAIDSVSKDLGAQVKTQCSALLKPGKSLDDIFKVIDTYYAQSEINSLNLDFAHWPRQSTKSQMELMIRCSDDLIDLHTSPKQLITNFLSEIVFKSCGRIMLNDSYSPTHPTQWIGHDVVAKYYQ